MRAKLLAMTALVASGVIATAFLVQSLSSSSAQTQTRPRYLPEYTASGDLVLPKNFNEWVYVGSPLTPIALNGGKKCPEPKSGLVPANSGRKAETISEARTHKS